jgi:hypothetical protein
VCDSKIDAQAGTQQGWDKERAALKLKFEQQKQVKPDEAAWAAEKADLRHKRDEAEIEKQEIIRKWEDERAALEGTVGGLREEIEKLPLQGQELHLKQSGEGEDAWKDQKSALDGEIKQLQAQCEEAKQAAARQAEKDKEEAASNMKLMSHLKEEAAEAKEAAARQVTEKVEFKSTLKSAIQRLQAERENAKEIAAERVAESDVLKETQETLEQERRERAALGNTFDLLDLRLKLLQCRKRSLLNERKNVRVCFGQEMEARREELTQAKAEVSGEWRECRHSGSLQKVRRRISRRKGSRERD